jgi:hypothetical protein
MPRQDHITTPPPMGASGARNGDVVPGCESNQTGRTARWADANGAAGWISTMVSGLPVAGCRLRAAGCERPLATTDRVSWGSQFSRCGPNDR